MLNRNKIESLINKGASNPSVVSRNTGLNYQTLKSKLKSGTWLAEEIEILALYFKKPIGYFFDKEEIQYLAIDNSDIVKEAPKSSSRICKECISKQNEIDALKLALEAKEELLQIYRDKKGGSAANSA